MMGVRFGVWSIDYDPAGAGGVRLEFRGEAKLTIDVVSLTPQEFEQLEIAIESLREMRALHSRDHKPE
jgi:hypothetical protein